ncbi:MAG: radical SAM protein [Candidatus Marsarchaeota archaeon]|jgi:MoaA/NifB/PqqE/SkfB family radical SAM enzyme|nr:radical SAM protein [Candidatus Marsarchaeota archaeon]MCL5418596.1 radical SAM protein [Candidatus Marsarchaeota archaeon]
MIKVRGSSGDNRIFFYESVPNRAVHYRVVTQAANATEYHNIAAKIKDRGLDFIERDNIIIDYAKVTITKNCFLRCAHCYVSGGELKHEISKDFALKIIDTLYDMGVINIRITGGEPLIYDGLFDVMDRAYKRDMFIHLTTNSILFNDRPELIRKVKEYDPVVSTSLDGPDIETHEAIRGPNTFDRTVGAIRELRENDVTVRVNTTLNKGAITRLDKMLYLLKDLDVKDWGLLELYFLGRAAKNDVMPDYGSVISALKQLQKAAKEVPEVEVHGYLFDILNGTRSADDPQCSDYKYRVDIEACENPNAVDIDTLPWPHRVRAASSDFERILAEQAAKRSAGGYELPSKDVCVGCDYQYKCLLSPYSQTLQYMNSRSTL